MSYLTTSLLVAAVVITGQDRTPGAGGPGGLDLQLRREDPACAGPRRRRLGDVRRGAVVFYQPALTCTKCHGIEGTGTPAPLGPDLTALGKNVSGPELVEAILEPSKAIKKGYETVTIVTDDGRTVTGLLAEDRSDAVVLRDPALDGKPITIAEGPDRTAEQQGTVAHAGRAGERAGARGSSSSTWCATSWRSPSMARRGHEHCGPTRLCSRRRCPITSAISTTPG